MKIRPIWNMNAAISIEEKEQNDLLTLESLINLTIKNYIAIIRTFEASTSTNIDSIESLISTASIDLIAGCEMARCGYLKQAYTLWRSWFEQVIFALYFLEAPLHREAWKCSESVSPNDSPRYRLMLHQLLTDSGERHAFTIVYTERYIKLIEILKSSKPSKSHEPLKRATRVLTQLSQGVHGTFRPKLMESLEKTCTQLKVDGIPALEAAWSATSEIWLLFIANIVDIPEEGWNLLRNGALTKEELIKYFKYDYSDEDTTEEYLISGIDKLLTLNEPFKNAFKDLKNG